MGVVILIWATLQCFGEAAARRCSGQIPENREDIIGHLYPSALKCKRVVLVLGRVEPVFCGSSSMQTLQGLYKERGLVGERAAGNEVAPVA